MKRGRQVSVNAIDFSELYAVHYDWLIRVSYSITKDVYLAEDVVQETFIKAMNKIDSINDTEKVAGWLTMITKRTAIDMIRAEHRKKGLLLEQDMLDGLAREMNQNVEKEVEDLLFIEQVGHAILNLTNKYQDVMILKMHHELTEQEIASLLNVKSSSVKTRIYRARKQLRSLFAEQLSA